MSDETMPRDRPLIVWAAESLYDGEPVSGWWTTEDRSEESEFARYRRDTDADRAADRALVYELQAAFADFSIVSTSIAKRKRAEDILNKIEQRLRGEG